MKECTLIRIRCTLVKGEPPRHLTSSFIGEAKDTKFTSVVMTEIN